MPKVITIYLTDEEAKEIERLCEEKGIARYTLIKIAIRELCAGSIPSVHTSLETSHKTKNPFNPAGVPSGFTAYLKEARYECASCHFPLVKVEGLKSCPLCGGTKYKEV